MSIVSPFALIIAGCTGVPESVEFDSGHDCAAVQRPALDILLTDAQGNTGFFATVLVEADGFSETATCGRGTGLVVDWDHCLTWRADGDTVPRTYEISVFGEDIWAEPRIASVALANDGEPITREVDIVVNRVAE